ncbi:uncharacterized protein LOC124964357 isoform X2 [Sciurus carolinensis]|uniref:uncharacterized protein LOC124964357 isoform X2 n=1 Tax=Sciurus carolinensis TaxID=30640 RepID=UPI001FB36775|nr:uncharacterized protein LOC124964357 isoform X2 [Sciurus carolinensis]
MRTWHSRTWIEASVASLLRRTPSSPLLWEGDVGAEVARTQRRRQRTKSTRDVSTQKHHNTHRAIGNEKLKHLISLPGLDNRPGAATLESATHLCPSRFASQPQLTANFAAVPAPLRGRAPVSLLPPGRERAEGEGRRVLSARRARRLGGPAVMSLTRRRRLSAAVKAREHRGANERAAGCAALRAEHRSSLGWSADPLPSKDLGAQSRAQGLEGCEQSPVGTHGHQHILEWVQLLSQELPKETRQDLCQ